MDKTTNYFGIYLAISTKWILPIRQCGSRFSRVWRVVI